MGFTIFTQSGTFNPADYGLKIGDMIQIVCVGGGGGLNNGSASSFGSIVTSSGGAGCGSQYYGGEGGWHPSLPVTMCAAIPDGMMTVEQPYSNAGGSCSRQVFLSGSSSSISTTTAYYGIGGMFGGGVGSYVTGAIGGYGGTRTISSNQGSWNGIGGTGSSASAYGNNSGVNVTCQCGGGGAGYGAGGGGGYAQGDYVAGPKKGGAHGQLKIVPYKLTSTSGIAITIGGGGSGGKTTNSNSYVQSGAGASGCVAIYW